MIEITKENVFKYSNSWKQMLKIGRSGTETAIIRSKAKAYLETNSLEYSKEKKAYLIKNTKIEIKNKNNQFICNCETFKNLPNIDNLICEHILYLKLMLKIWNSQRRISNEISKEFSD